MNANVLSKVVLLFLAVSIGLPASAQSTQPIQNIAPQSIEFTSSLIFEGGPVETNLIEAVLVVARDYTSEVRDWRVTSFLSLPKYGELKSMGGGKYSYTPNDTGTDSIVYVMESNSGKKIAVTWGIVIESAAEE